MKILYLHQYFATPESHAGTRSYEFARRLIANGHQVHMVTSSAALPTKYHLAGETAHDCVIEGIPTTVIQVPYSNSFGFVARLKAFVKFALLSTREAMSHPADIVFATSTPLTIAIPGIAARLRHRVPLVFEVRDLWPEMPIAIGALRNPLFKWLARCLEWVAYHASAHIVALSPGMAEGVISRGISPERVTVIPNSCDIDMFSVPESRGKQIRDRLGLSEGQPLVVYTGTFGLVNGVSYLVDLAAQMQRIAPDIYFLLVGEGAEAQKVEAHARQLGVLGKNLSIWEPLPKAEMPDLLAAASVATSLFVALKPMWNNSANKFFDSLAAGRPIAINYGGWQADLLERSGAGIVLPHDDTALAAQLLASFLADSHQLGNAAMSARALGQMEFNRDLMASRLEAVLQSALHKKKHTYERNDKQPQKAIR
jgi:glycosyltransferase involved in cell wall biosynthesis